MRSLMSVIILFCSTLSYAQSTENSIDKEKNSKSPKAYYELGNKFYDDEKYPEAVKWYRKAARQGYAPGQTYLGAMYYKGLGVVKNDTEAVKWIRKAAEQEYALAQCCLGSMYMYGEGVDKDKVEAVKWFRKAAVNGDAEAQQILTKLGETW